MDDIIEMLSGDFMVEEAADSMLLQGETSAEVRRSVKIRAGRKVQMARLRSALRRLNEEEGITMQNVPEGHGGTSDGGKGKRTVRDGQHVNGDNNVRYGQHGCKCECVRDGQGGNGDTTVRDGDGDCGCGRRNFKNRHVCDGQDGEGDNKLRGMQQGYNVDNKCRDGQPGGNRRIRSRRTTRWQKADNKFATDNIVAMGDNAFATDTAVANAASVG